MLATAPAFIESPADVPKSSPNRVKAASLESTLSQEQRKSMELTFRDYDVVTGHPWYRDMIDETVTRIPDLPDGSDLLVIGCGTGADIAAVRARFGDRINIAGLDHNAAMLSIAQEKFCGDTSVRFIQGDVRELGTSVARADAILAPNLLHYFDSSEKKAILEQAWDLLPSDGSLIACTGFFRGATPIPVNNFFLYYVNSMLNTVHETFPEQYQSILSTLQDRYPDQKQYDALFQDAGFSIRSEIREYAIPQHSIRAFYLSTETISTIMPGLPLSDARRVSLDALDEASGHFQPDQLVQRKWLFHVGRKS